MQILVPEALRAPDEDKDRGMCVLGYVDLCLKTLPANHQRMGNKAVWESSDDRYPFWLQDRANLPTMKDEVYKLFLKLSLRTGTELRFRHSIAPVAPCGVWSRSAAILQGKI